MLIDLPGDEDFLRRQHWALPTDLTRLLHIWGADDQNVTPVLEFLNSPAALPMPPEVLVEVAEWLNERDALDRMPGQAKRRLRELRGRD